MAAPRGALGPNLLLLAAALLFAALLGEVGLRLLAHARNQGLLSVALSEPVPVPADGVVHLGHMVRLSENPRIIYELKPQLAVSFFGAPVTTNATGFRGPDLPTAKPPGTRRIVGIGDSFMFGHGVGDGETYLRRLEELLDRHSTGPRFEVLNTAAPGYNTVMEVELLERRALAWEPDLVIVHFVGNDLNLPNFIRVPEPVLSLERSFLAELVRGFLGSRSWAAGLGGPELIEAPLAPNARDFAGDPDQVPPEYRWMVGWQAWEAAMGRLAELAERHRFRVLVLSTAPRLGGRHARALEHGRELGFATLAAGATYRAWLEAHGHERYRGSPLTLSADDMHPSPLGHALAARALYESLCAEQFAGELAPCVLEPAARPS